MMYFRSRVSVLLPLAHSAVFDNIDHQTLHCLGVSGKPLLWMPSYPTERNQSVCVDGELPEPVLMEYSEALRDVQETTWISHPGPWAQHHFYADDTQL